MPIGRNDDDPLPDDDDSGEDELLEDDDMPPLVDQPATSPMTYTFFTEMTPLSFSNKSFASSSSSQQTPPQWDPTFTSYEPHEPTPTLQQSVDTPSTLLTDFEYPQRASHGKRRDPSHIPRPPNAFILFRSSFIREQQVTGRVEGSHSNLSKIIGMVWRQLPKAERDSWEAKAQQARLEHRKRYPDWRFTPIANMTASSSSKGKAKVKLKKRTGARRGSVKDPPTLDGGGEGMDMEKTEEEVGDEGEEEDADGEYDEDDERNSDSDYEERPSKAKAKSKSKSKGKGKARASTSTRPTTTISRPTRTSLRTRARKKIYGTRLDFSLIDSSSPPSATTPLPALPSSMIPRSKEATTARLAKIAELVVEGKTGVELEIALDNWEASGGRTPAGDGEKESPAVVGGESLNREETYHGLPMIITTAPATSSSSSPPSMKNISTENSLQSPPRPLLTPDVPSSYSPTAYSPTVSYRAAPTPPPQSPVTEIVVAGYKRSRSAPASDETERHRHGLGIPASSGSLPIISSDGAGWYTTPGLGSGSEITGVVRKRHRSSASISGPMTMTTLDGAGGGWGMYGGGGGTRFRASFSSPSASFQPTGMDMPRRETISLPLDRTRSHVGHHHAVAGVSGPHGRSTTVPLHATHARAYQAQAYTAESSYMGGTAGEGEAYVTSPVSIDTPGQSGYYSSPSPHPHPPPPHSAPYSSMPGPITASPWHLTQYQRNWWPSHSHSIPQAYPTTRAIRPIEAYEPIREGSFENSPSIAESSAGSYGFDTGAAGQPMYEEMGRRYMERFPYARDEGVEDDSRRGVYGEERQNQQEEPERHSTQSDTSPIIVTLTSSHIQHNHRPLHLGPSHTQAEGVAAGGVFHPLPPSSFSSLTGWDGSAAVDVRARSDSDNLKAREETNTNAGKQGPWYRPWNSVQSVGVVMGSTGQDSQGEEGGESSGVVSGR